jgi:hypothetical protein
LEAYKEKVKSAKKAREKWENDCDLQKALGNEAPPMPPEANTPAEVIMPRVLVSDATSEALGRLLSKHPNGLVQYRDELAGWLGNMNRYSGGTGGDRQFWLEAYGGGRYKIDRIKHPIPLTIPHLSVGVIGGIQPDALVSIMKGPEDGLISRFMWAWPDVVPGYSIVREVVDNSLQLAALQRIFALEMSEFTDEPPLVPFSCKASAIFEKFVIRNKARESFGRMKATIGKGPGHVARLSMVLSLLGWSHREAPEPKQIEEKYVSAAIHLVEDYFYPMAERAFQEAALPDTDVKARKLAQWIRKSEARTFNAKDVRLTIGGDIRDSKVMDAACVCLMDAYLIQRPASKPAQKGGRPPKNYEANPRIWEPEASMVSGAA